MNFKVLNSFVLRILFLSLLVNAQLNENYYKNDFTECVDSRMAEIHTIYSDEVNTTNSAFMGEKYYITYEEMNSWLLKFPILPILFATSPTLPEGNCKSHAQKYLRELRNGTLWAARMFDSSVKYPEGIITGHTRHFGNFDECYQLNAKIPRDNSVSKFDDISGRYCLVKIHYEKMNKSPDKVISHTLNFDLYDSVWEAIKMTEKEDIKHGILYLFSCMHRPEKAINVIGETGDFRRVRRYILELALCVPSSCSPEEVQLALSEPLRKFGDEEHIFVDTSIKGNECQAKVDETEFSTLAKVYCYALLTLALLVGLSTWYDSSLERREKIEVEGLPVNLFLCFSVRRNLKNITEISYTHPGLDSIHMIRFSLTCLAIFAHRMMQYYSNPMINSEDLEKSYSSIAGTFIYNGPLIVHGFFALGGLLVSYYVLMELDKKGKINFYAAIIIRYIRLTPAYAVVIAFIALVLPHLGSGPYWSYKIINIESSSCAENWWTNILYINNYVNPERMCMFQSWYLPVDYHLYILAIFAIVFFWKLPRSLGFSFLIGIIILGSAVPFYKTYRYNLQAIYLGLPYMQEVREDPYFINHYVKTHERIAAYFIGILAGVLIYDHKLSPWKLRKPWSISLFVLLVVVLTSIILNLGKKFYDPNIHPTPLQKALYASLHRPLFAVAVVSIVVLLTVGEGLEFYQKFLTPGWVQPFARLSYSAYLIHNVYQSYQIASLRQSRTFSLQEAMSDFMVDLLLTFFLSLVMTLIIEGPFRRIEKIFTNRRIPEKRSTSESAENSTDIRKKVD